MTEDQQYCIDMLAEWADGRHHLPKVHEWGKGICINFRGDLSTYDFDRLTRLVLLAHRDAVRVEIGSSGFGMVRIVAHRRKHGIKEHGWKGHPTIDDLVRRIGAMRPRKETEQEAVHDADCAITINARHGCTCGAEAGKDG